MMKLLLIILMTAIWILKKKKRNQTRKHYGMNRNYYNNIKEEELEEISDLFKEKNCIIGILFYIRKLTANELARNATFNIFDMN